MECSIVSLESLPNNRWNGILQKQINSLKHGQAIRIILPRKQKVGGLLTAWYRLCAKTLEGKKAKTMQRKHELGTTVWLWWE